MYIAAHICTALNVFEATERSKHACCSQPRTELLPYTSTTVKHAALMIRRFDHDESRKRRYEHTRAQFYIHTSQR